MVGWGFPVATKPLPRPHLLAPSQEIPPWDKGTRGLRPDPQETGSSFQLMRSPPQRCTHLSS